MSGEPDPFYVAARSVLLDALSALGAQRKAAILIGAQAIYMHTGSIHFAVAEYTTDADIALDPASLERAPEIDSAMRAAGFLRGNRVGAWSVSREIAGVYANVEVDLMVPEALGGAGKRAARLAGHAKHVARKARGLEAALIDKSLTIVKSLDPMDERTFSIAVAGPAALMVSKLHKLQERLGEREQRRVDSKDALDVLRLLQAVPTLDLAGTFAQLLGAPLSEQVTREALASLQALFAGARAAGSEMAASAAGPLANPDEIAGSCVLLTRDLLQAISAV